MRAHWLVGVVMAVGVLPGQQRERLTTDVAGKAVGQVATVCGLVVGFDCADGHASGLVFRTDSWSPAFKVAVDGLGRTWFDSALEQRYFGQQACVTGTVLSVAHGFHIRASQPDQLSVEGTPRAEAGKSRRACSGVLAKEARCRASSGRSGRSIRPAP